MIRTTLSSAVLLAIGGLAAAQDVSPTTGTPTDPPNVTAVQPEVREGVQEGAQDRPDRPSGLAVSVYSPTAAGLRWDRAPVFGERYEISRDGEIVEPLTSATSFIDTTLMGGTTYTFDVVALDREGNRSDVSRLLVNTTEEPMPPEGPPAPEGLRSAVYSATVIELFWERAATPGLLYEVRRDGELVGTTDGTSFFDDALTGGTEYDYTVVTLAAGEQRSAPARQSVTTAGERPPPPAMDVPAAPGGLRSAVYSATAAELFWERAARPGLRYEVRRDGEVVATTDGTSYFDDALMGGASYVYAVVAIDGERRSAPSTTTVATVGESVSPLFLGRPWREVADQALAILDARPLLDVAARVGEIATDTLGAPEPRESRDGSADATLACPGGGTLLSNRSFLEQATRTLVENGYDFDACLLDDGTRIDGRSRDSSDSVFFGTGARFDSTLLLDGLSIAGDEGELLVESGSFNRNDSRDLTTPCGNVATETAALTGVVPVALGGGDLRDLAASYAISEVRGNRSGTFCVDAQTFADRATVQLPDGQIVAIERSGEVRGPLDGEFPDGFMPNALLRITLEGTSDLLSVQAVPGGTPEAVQVIVNDASVVTFPATFEWSTR